MAKYSTEREETAQDFQVFLLAEAYEDQINQFLKASKQGSVWPTDFQLAFLGTIYCSCTLAFER